MIINHIGISGGKDSTALLLWAVNESGYPRESIDATFCDTGNEASQTYEYIAMLSECVHPIQTIRADRTFYELAMHKTRFPGPIRRFCTVELKLKPTKAHLQSLWDSGADVLLHAGIRASESADRAAMPERGFDEYFGCDVYRPLLRWSLADVWAIHERYGIPRNPLYDMGAKRVGCLPCIMSQKSELLMIARAMPERVEFLREKEREMNDGRKREGSYAPFFDCTKIPVRYRHQPYTRKDGSVDYAASIDDVMAWAAPPGAGTQIDFAFDDLEEPPTCSSRSGLCE